MPIDEIGQHGSVGMEHAKPPQTPAADVSAQGDDVVLGIVSSFVQGIISTTVIGAAVGSGWKILGLFRGSTSRNKVQNRGAARPQPPLDPAREARVRELSDGIQGQVRTARQAAFQRVKAAREAYKADPTPERQKNLNAAVREHARLSPLQWTEGRRLTIARKWLAVPEVTREALRIWEPSGEAIRRVQLSVAPAQRDRAVADMTQHGAISPGETRTPTEGEVIPWKWLLKASNGGRTHYMESGALGRVVWLSLQNMGSMRFEVVKAEDGSVDMSATRSPVEKTLSGSSWFSSLRPDTRRDVVDIVSDEALLTARSKGEMRVDLPMQQVMRALRESGKVVVADAATKAPIAAGELPTQTEGAPERRAVGSDPAVAGREDGRMRDIVPAAEAVLSDPVQPDWAARLPRSLRPAMWAAIQESVAALREKPWFQELPPAEQQRIQDGLCNDVKLPDSVARQPVGPHQANFIRAYQHQVMELHGKSWFRNLSPERQSAIRSIMIHNIFVDAGMQNHVQVNVDGSAAFEGFERTIIEATRAERMQRRGQIPLGSEWSYENRMRDARFAAEVILESDASLRQIDPFMKIAITQAYGNMVANGLVEGVTVGDPMNVEHLLHISEEMVMMPSDREALERARARLRIPRRASVRDSREASAVERDRTMPEALQHMREQQERMKKQREELTAQRERIAETREGPRRGRR